MRKLMVLLAIAGLMLTALPLAQAAEVPVLAADYTGSRWVGDGRTIGSGLYNGIGNNGFLISWNIVAGTGTELGEFEYNYTISGGAPGAISLLSSNLKNLYLQVSPTFNVIESTEVTPAAYAIGDPTAGGVAFHSIYWTTLANDTLAVHFDSLSPPVWGSFFADDGSAFVSGTSTYAHNGDFPRFANDAFPYTVLDYIPVPNTAVPVPPAVWLFGSGLVGLFGLRRKFSK